ncbi:hypothetical protein CGK32_22220, partial [Vibrio parahaemolyticus]|uniref:hypothetical protein n=1 Tax=Vibrio parahaemolyticus TaxID=670 RepID=UPI00116F36A9
LCQLYHLTETFIAHLDEAIITTYAAVKDYSAFIEDKYTDKSMQCLRYELYKDNEKLISYTMPPEIKSMEHLVQLFS